MRKSAGITGIGQISRHVHNLNAAVTWYRDVLGLTHLFTFSPLAFFDCDGVRLFLSAENVDAVGRDSIIYFRTEDITATHQDLVGRGVTFRSAPHMVHRHASGVEEWMAFFEDPEGGTLALTRQVGP